MTETGSEREPTEWAVIATMCPMIICLVLVLLTTPVFPNFPIAQLGVTDGEYNGTLKLGTFGNCLYLPNETCSHSFADVIVTYSLFRVGSNAHIPISPFVTKSISAVNILALFAAFMSFIWEPYSLTAGTFATIGAALAAIAMVLEMTFIIPLGGNSIGPGFIIGIIEVFVLSFFAIYSCWKADKKYEESNKPNPCGFILCCCRQRPRRAS